MDIRIVSASEGWVVAPPIAFGVASAIVAGTRGHGDTSLIALSAAGHLVPTVANPIGSAWLTTRLGALGGPVLARFIYVAAFITVADQCSGLGFAGGIGAFPTMSTTMAPFIAHRSGVRNANSVMGGMVKSFPIYPT
jgi:hypothetical protein